MEKASLWDKVSVSLLITRNVFTIPQWRRNCLHELTSTRKNLCPLRTWSTWTYLNKARINHSQVNTIAATSSYFRLSISYTCYCCRLFCSPSGYGQIALRYPGVINQRNRPRKRPKAGVADFSTLSRVMDGHGRRELMGHGVSGRTSGPGRGAVNSEKSLHGGVS